MAEIEIGVLQRQCSSLRQILPQQLADLRVIVYDQYVRIHGLRHDGSLHTIQWADSRTRASDSASSRRCSGFRRTSFTPISTAHLVS
jgi:hypothetical protein